MLLKHILDKGVTKSDRTGTGTKSVFGYQIRHDMSEGFPLLTTKKMHLKSMLHELLWFLAGNDNVSYLINNGVNIWNEWPFQRYFNEHAPDELYEMGATAFLRKCKEDPEFAEMHKAFTMEIFIQRMKSDSTFAKDYGDTGRIYGKQWIDFRSWEGEHEAMMTRSVNQIAEMVKLLKTNPDSRRMLVSAWNAADVEGMLLPPCYYAFQLYTTELTTEERLHILSELGITTFVDTYKTIYTGKNIKEALTEFGVPERKLSMMWQIRSVDTFLGMPFDMAEHGLLLMMFAHVANMVPDELIMTSGDTHLYLNHLEAARTQLERYPYRLPTMRINRGVRDIFDFKYDDFELVGYDGYCHPAIKAEISI